MLISSQIGICSCIRVFLRYFFICTLFTLVLTSRKSPRKLTCLFSSPCIQPCQLQALSVSTTTGDNAIAASCDTTNPATPCMSFVSAPERGDNATPLPPQTTAVASLQHQHEQNMLAGYTVPNPPVATRQLSAAATAIDSSHKPHQAPSQPPLHQKLQLLLLLPLPPRNQPQQTSSSSSHLPRTLWMGDLDPWLDETSIESLWWQILGAKITSKIIKPKPQPQDGTQAHVGLSHSGYCFIEFESFEDAQKALGLNGQLLPDIAMPSQQQFPNNPNNQKKYFRLNWASGATLSAPIVHTPEFSLFVGDLSASTTEAHLLAFFQKSFPHAVKTVRVMTDPVSGKSRCFGFVRFTDDALRQRALVELQGSWFGGRPLRLALATPRTNNRQFIQQQHQHPPIQPQPHPQHSYPYYAPPYQQQFHYQALSPQTRLFYYDYTLPKSEAEIQPSPYYDYRWSGVDALAKTSDRKSLASYFNDPHNTTVFVGGLSSEVSEHTLFMLFKPFGSIQQIKIPPGKNCGFIKYSTREEAEEAIAAMEGFIIGGNAVRLSWGRLSVNNKRYQLQQQQIAHAAQIEAAAAISMGLGPNSSIAVAASAVAAAGGFSPAHLHGHAMMPVPHSGSPFPIMAGLPHMMPTPPPPQSVPGYAPEILPELPANSQKQADRASVEDQLNLGPAPAPTGSEKDEATLSSAMSNITLHGPPQFVSPGVPLAIPAYPMAQQCADPRYIAYLPRHGADSNEQSTKKPPSAEVGIPSRPEPTSSSSGNSPANET
jgi:RNA recognition motif-containing protein